MDLNEIKKLIEKEGGKIIVIENGKPVMVITSFQDYQEKADLRKKENQPPPPQEIEDDDLKIEDLPF